ncbi:hypothetical protein [Methylocystis heyeri]|uniref:Uncharacterized protein n=1 Tax=Methylocystis heyeri TaxID=391905 RepID=A0A6B8KH35_9HYPH|nr:hypothetical protein [Methylocystis heyeri]QGM46275.1 hypothetical protein H2LOC_011515 [Methylocystis heyeri]
MSEQTSAQKSEASSKYESREENGNGKVLKRAIILILAIINAAISGYITWPKSHEGAFIQFLAVSLGALAAADLSIVISFIIALICVFVAVVVYFKFPVSAPPPITGWLQPGNEPTPENACSIAQSRLGEGSLLLMGGEAFLNIASPSAQRSQVAVQMGECRLLTVNVTPNGVAIDAVLYDENGKYIGDIRKNKVTLDGSRDLIIERSADLTTLVVHDRNDREILRVKYINARAITARGIFSCPKSMTRSITITDKYIDVIKGMSGNCSVNALVGISFP